MEICNLNQFHNLNNSGIIVPVEKRRLKIKVNCPVLASVVFNERPVSCLIDLTSEAVYGRDK